MAAEIQSMQTDSLVPLAEDAEAKGNPARVVQRAVSCGAVSCLCTDVLCTLYSVRADATLFRDGTIVKI